MRAFVAVEVPPPSGESRRGPAPEHLTLLFLGEIPRERVGPIAEALGPVGEKVAPFDATLEGVGAFPSPDRPRVVWVGMTEGAAEMTRLASRVREALEGEGEPDRRGTFSPHLTLFRVRSGTDHRKAVELLRGTVPSPQPRRFHVGEFVLKESDLSSRGATHRTVASFPLRGSASETG
ncbi:MAG TPA: RNA 2',3'-cyclic phosphodiesterase [Thermoplasmata archaeon]|nr:RNA 2',3'-cyclic phosphodiesterase [Thermoplasmata archaeon]